MGLDAFSTACATTAAQMRLQADGMDLQIVRALPRYKYELRDQRAGEQDRTITARCLPDTWSLYEQRLFHAAQAVDMLVVRSHNAVAPLPVLCLEDGHYYKAGTIPTITREQLTRRNEKEMHLVVSMLALGLEAGEQILAKMSVRSRKRYQALLADKLAPRPGRVPTI